MDDLRNYLLLIRRHWLIPFWCCTLCLGSAVYFAYTIPPIYRATGTIIIESAEITIDTARRVAAGRGIDQHLDLVRRRVMSDESLQMLINKHELFGELTPRQRISAVARNVSLEQVDPVTMEPLIGGSAFHVHFDYPDRSKARDVATDLIELFLEDNRAARTQAAADTREFFAEQAKLLAERVAEAETRLASFKRENQGFLPDDTRLNQQALERAERDLNAVRSEIRLSIERRNLLRVQLDALGMNNELAELKSELTLLQQRYSEDHPDIKRLRRTIANLEQAGEPASQNDTEYRQVSAQLAFVEDEVAAFRSRESQLQQEIREYSDRLVLAPDVEKELQKLDREYQMVSVEHREMRQRRAEAEFASNLEEQDKGQRYAEMRPARAPSAPYSPNRLGIILIGTILAFGGSAALVAIREGADDTVRSAQDIIDTFGAPPIVTIPVIFNEHDILIRRRRVTANAIVWIAFVGITVGAVWYG